MELNEARSTPKVLVLLVFCFLVVDRRSEWLRSLRGWHPILYVYRAKLMAKCETVLVLFKHPVEIGILGIAIA